MRTLQLTVQPTCVGHHSQKGFHLQLILNLCTDGYRGQVWLYVMIVSVLCRSTCAHNEPEVEGVLHCIERVKPKIENSTAMLYTPPPQIFTGKCDTVSLMCYMLELTMVINEEQVHNNHTDCISGFKNELNETSKAYTGTCPPCEDTTTLRNLTVFLDNLVSVLKLLKTKANTS